MRSICLSLLWAWVALVFLARKRSTNSMRRAISRCWCLVGGEQLLLVGLALLEVVVVVAAVADEPALADLDDAADELVEELAVVRDEEDRAGVGLEVVLEPEQGFEVEVVGGLVEQQQVGLLRRAGGPGGRA